MNRAALIGMRQLHEATKPRDEKGHELFGGMPIHESDGSEPTVCKHCGIAYGMVEALSPEEEFAMEEREADRYERAQRRREEF